jgi:hypothetical protein
MPLLWVPAQIFGALADHLDGWNGRGRARDPPLEPRPVTRAAT